jgi:ubiquilin
MSARLVIKLVSAGGREFPVEADLQATVAELKEQIAGQAELPKENIRLVCAGRIWQDTATVASYEPRESAVVHCLNNPPRAVPNASEQVLTPVNPMQQMLGGGGAQQPPPANGDPFAQMMWQSQQMMRQNPEMMQQMMNSPMMQQMMSDPETVRSMVRMNPQLSQLMEQQPEIARLLEDPEVLQQSMRMMQNPSLMQEMQRNSDRAIGQLDAMPGGYNALVRAHEEMVDPLMNALSGSGQDGAAPVAEYAQQTSGGPNNEALPNPWGAPAPAQSTPAATPAATPSLPVGAPAGGAGFPTMGAQPNVPPMGNAQNPMAAMMQQMMNNPAMMNPAMASPQGGYNAPAVPPATVPAATGVPPALNPNPFAPFAPQGGAAANPMAAMMQQMMNNPAMMQQSMQMAQQMYGGNAAGQPNMFGAPAFTPPAVQPAAAAPGATAPAAPAAPDALLRVQFASQLAQLSGMGFSNEAACLRALQQHGGRIDSAIDTLLSSGDS